MKHFFLHTNLGNALVWAGIFLGCMGSLTGALWLVGHLTGGN
jgi:hypothetical protein